MLDVARSRLPALPALTADVRALPVQAGSAAAIVAFYVVQHLRRDDIAGVLGELRRCLRRDGLVAVAAHEGVGEFAVGEVTATLYTAGELAEALRIARLEVETVERRAPLAQERQGPRIYIVARATEPDRRAA